MVTSKLTAIKFTPEHGHLNLQVRANTDENLIQFSLRSLPSINEGKLWGNIHGKMYGFLSMI
jgi:hypothetical protein